LQNAWRFATLALFRRAVSISLCASAAFNRRALAASVAGLARPACGSEGKATRSKPLNFFV
jgi:hypothetical protein